MAVGSAADTGRLSIGDLSRRTGCSIDTIRYYERIRLMPKVERTEGGHRLYDGEHVRRLAFIRRSRALGLGLDQVRAILGGVERDAYGCAEVRALLAECAKGVRRQIDELQEIEGNLCMLVEACGDAELSNCRLIEAMLAGDESTVDPGCCCTG